LALTSIKELKASTKEILGEEFMKDITYGDTPIMWFEERKQENGLDSETIAVSMQMNVNALINNTPS